MQPPLGLLRHRIQVWRDYPTGTGTGTQVVSAGLPCLLTDDTKTVMLPDGPMVRRQYTARTRPGADITRGDRIVTFDGGEATVQHVRHVPGPSGGVAWIEAVAW